jgi:hypothetical protein
MWEAIVWAIFCSLLTLGGVTMSLNPPDFAATRVMFFLAALVLLGRIAWWITFEYHFEHQLLTTILALALFCGVGLALICGLHWVAGREDRYKEQDMTPTAFLLTPETKLPALIDRTWKALQPFLSKSKQAERYTKKEGEQPMPAKSFLLADCTFDGRFKVGGNFEAFRNAFPDSGTATILMDIYPKDKPKVNMNMKLSGHWQGTTGMMPIISEDSVVFTLSEQMFTFYHKKPIIEYATKNMIRIYPGKEYVIELTGFPGFAVPLIPEILNIRTREGLTVTIPDFGSLKDRPGWYCASFKLG